MKNLKNKKVADILNIIKDVWGGFLIGAGNIIPGVSGGTIAFILGIYEKLIESVNKHNLSYIKDFMKFFKSLASFKKENFMNFYRFLQNRGTLFLLKIAGGGAVAILLLSPLLKEALENSQEAVYAFFLALVFMSIQIPLRQIQKKTVMTRVIFILFFFITGWFSVSHDPSQKAEVKSLKRKQEATLLSETSSRSMSLTETKKHVIKKHASKISLKKAVVLFLAGSGAVSAMILPGISGSFILLLSGQYKNVLELVVGLKNFIISDIILLGFFLIGTAVGALFFCRFISWLFSKARDLTLSALGGLITGSCLYLWPFRNFKYMDLFVKEGGNIFLKPQVKVYTDSLYLPAPVHPGTFFDFFNRLAEPLSIFFSPGFSFSYYIVIAASFAAGIAIMGVFQFYEKNVRPENR